MGGSEKGKCNERKQRGKEKEKTRNANPETPLIACITTKRNQSSQKSLRLSFVFHSTSGQVIFYGPHGDHPAKDDASNSTAHQPTVGKDGKNSGTREEARIYTEKRANKEINISQIEKT